MDVILQTTSITEMAQLFIWCVCVSYFLEYQKSKILFDKKKSSAFDAGVNFQAQVLIQNSNFSSNLAVFQLVCTMEKLLLTVNTKTNTNGNGGAISIQLGKVMQPTLFTILVVCVFFF